MNPHVNAIAGQLNLCAPQRRSLEIGTSAAFDFARCAE